MSTSGLHSSQISLLTGERLAMVDGAPCEHEPEWAARAETLLHWFSTAHAAWLHRERDAGWTGWAAADAAATAHSAAWQPWTAVSDASEAPYVRWFCDALTNAAFNELDRHVLQVCDSVHGTHRFRTCIFPGSAAALEL